MRLTAMRQSLVAVFVLVAFLAQATWTLAGTTGTLSGNVFDATANSAPVSGAKVTAISPSQVATVTTDSNGHFVFLALAPDTYTVSIDKQGYDPLSQAGVSVFADQNQTLNLSVQRALRVIGRVTSRSLSDLVKPSTTSDIYSINAVTADKAAVLGGGGSTQQMYSAIAAAPGTFVPTGQSGWNQAVYVRGSNYDQTGYEYDGVPVNRAFDNYAAHTGTSLGQQELQVYTGGGPASASATGLGGFINQVIRTGTYPAFGSATAGLGAPTFYHNLGFEAGGASPSRNFSYYAGFLGFDQDFRYVDQSNGASNPYNVFFYPFTLNTAAGTGVAPACVKGASPFANGTQALPAGMSADPGCYSGPFPGSIETASHITNREIVANFHFGIPHNGGALKDDIQLLYTNSLLDTWWPDSRNDLGTSTLLNVFGAVSTAFRNSLYYPASKIPFGTPATGLVASPYIFPNTQGYQQNGNFIPGTLRDGFENDASIIKLQYQRNMSDSAFLRVFGYTFYSDWLNNAAVSRSVSPFGFLPVNVSPDYLLDTHTRGVELQFVDQLNSKNLVNFTGNYVTGTTTRWNDGTPSNSAATRATNLVDAAGNCYTATGATGLCNTAATAGTFGNPTPFAATGAAAAAGATWIATQVGAFGPLNTVVPQFASLSLTDQWTPNTKLNINAGIRFESLGYKLSNANNPGENFWAAAAVREFCYNTTSLAYTGVRATCAAGSAHPDGVGGHLLYSNASPATYTPTVWEPRIAGTYTFDPNTVLRASFSTSAQPPNTASVQYLTSQPNTPGYFFPKFISVGYTTPFHSVRPAVANNYDVSLEKRVSNDLSFKLTPYYRYTRDYLQNVFIDQATQYVSAINAGNTRAYGVEFQVQKGDFNRDGFAALLNYTYTNTKERYTNLGNSSVNVIDQVNAGMATFNGFTKAGGGSPCYSNTTTGTGAPTACSDPTAILNPYYNMAPQAPLDRNGWYEGPYLYTPAIVGAGPVTNIAPHVASVILNYKHQRLAITPSLQLIAGQKYGVQINQYGWDPTSCGQNQAGVPTAVAAGRGQYADYTSCTGSLFIPNPESGVFDAMGAYTEPAQIIGNVQLSYDLSPKVTAVLSFVNAFNTCFGGSKMPWTVGGSKTCGYSLDAYTGEAGVGNFYNGTGPTDLAANGAVVPAQFLHSYYAAPGLFVQPFQMYFTLKFRM